MGGDRNFADTRQPSAAWRRAGSTPARFSFQGGSYWTNEYDGMLSTAGGRHVENLRD